MKCREKYAPSTLWVICSYVNTSFINKLGVSLKGLPHIHRYLKMETLHYVYKKVTTFNTDLMMTMEERNTPNATLYTVSIALLYFGLLCAGEVRIIEVKDVIVIDNEKLKRIHVNFVYPQKRHNIGMDYYVPDDFLPVFKKHISEICQPIVKQGHLQF